MLKILHLASFTGNIGDNASNIGFGNILSRCLSDGYKITPIELRKFYTNYTLPDKHFFDRAFVDLANAQDLVVMGGGGILSFDIEGSATGTTLDIGENIWKEITAPVLITSVGIIANAIVPAGNEEKFKSFVRLLLGRKKTVLALRNDGSHKALVRMFDKAELEAIPQVLDSGFFYAPSGRVYDALPSKYIAINITREQIQKGGGVIVIDEDVYYGEMRNVLRHILDATDMHIVFVPHIHGDLAAIVRVLDGLTDFTVRSRIQVAPHVQGDRGADLLFSIYKGSGLTLGTRFHANVCSLAMGVPCIGLVAQPRVRAMYASLGLSHECVNLEGAFSSELIAAVDRMCLGKDAGDGTARRTMIDQERERTVNLYRQFFETLGLSARL
ncbi:hypothetical protein A2704_05050 [Candidatus Kaiserbacteria bacterium RIFCSPHIGHO2_01_FULL_54_36b]|uniref:Polysaccharide pyruvyl transferase domain-containing protein n=1 Tax=Candidatus Kaiserbacteria bacterium RIFCSPHIGHO2_01_FULL_54_36b TaxID=1798483 RepID=A0A1F6CN16_9BACT|nr:MAG: hypothetical protein A2704_05050 [Candidatus Kaiserbacteria bacterium RIFCSPHIGHO2_01_FULL_54_36b]